LTTQEARLAIVEQLANKISLGINIFDKIDGSDSMTASRFEIGNLPAAFKLVSPPSGTHHVPTNWGSPWPPFYYRNPGL